MNSQNLETKAPVPQAIWAIGEGFRIEQTMLEQLGPVIDLWVCVADFKRTDFSVLLPRQAPPHNEVVWFYQNREPSVGGYTLDDETIGLRTWPVIAWKYGLDGCGGLSGGGMRTVFLGGMDARIKAAICMGFMTTWKDFLLYKSHTHTWMTYLPLAPNDLDFPEILGLRVPLPTLVQNCREDPLYTMEGMEEAERILGEIYTKAGAAEKYRCSFYPGGHKFDREMQAEAFDWWDRWLKEP